MDRIDIHLDVSRPRPNELLRAAAGASSDALREGVLAGRSFASWRRAREQEDMARTANMSARGIVRTLRIARAIADLEERECTGENAVAEALGYRVRDGVGGAGNGA